MMGVMVGNMAVNNEAFLVAFSNKIGIRLSTTTERVLACSFYVVNSLLLIYEQLQPCARGFAMRWRSEHSDCALLVSECP